MENKTQPLVITTRKFDDDFFMYTYKVLPCSNWRTHDWRSCPFSHKGENAARRDPRKVNYLSVCCPESKAKQACPRGDSCPFAHSMFEFWLHPSRYRTKMCNDGVGCQRTICFFAHETSELRTPTYAGGEDGQMAAAAAAAAGLTGALPTDMCHTSGSTRSSGTRWPLPGVGQRAAAAAKGAAAAAAAAAKERESAAIGDAGHLGGSLINSDVPGVRDSMAEWAQLRAAQLAAAKSGGGGGGHSGLAAGRDKDTFLAQQRQLAPIKVMSHGHHMGGPRGMASGFGGGLGGDHGGGGGGMGHGLSFPPGLSGGGSAELHQQLERHNAAVAAALAAGVDSSVLWSAPGCIAESPLAGPESPAIFDGTRHISPAMDALVPGCMVNGQWMSLAMLREPGSARSAHSTAPFGEAGTGGSASAWLQQGAGTPWTLTNSAASSPNAFLAHVTPSSGLGTIVTPSNGTWSPAVASHLSTVTGYEASPTCGVTSQVGPGSALPGKFLPLPGLHHSYYQDDLVATSAGGAGGGMGGAGGQDGHAGGGLGVVGALLLAGAGNGASGGAMAQPAMGASSLGMSCLGMGNSGGELLPGAGQAPAATAGLGAVANGTMEELANMLAARQLCDSNLAALLPSGTF